MLPNDKIRELVMNKASSEEIKKATLASGMKGLREDAEEKVKSGLTSAEEVQKITET